MLLVMVGCFAWHPYPAFDADADADADSDADADADSDADADADADTDGCWDDVHEPNDDPTTALPAVFEEELVVSPASPDLWTLEVPGSASFTYTAELSDPYFVDLAVRQDGEEVGWGQTGGTVASVEWNNPDPFPVQIELELSTLSCVQYNASVAWDVGCASDPLEPNDTPGTRRLVVSDGASLMGLWSHPLDPDHFEIVMAPWTRLRVTVLAAGNLTLNRVDVNGGIQGTIMGGPSGTPELTFNNNTPQPVSSYWLVSNPTECLGYALFTSSISLP